MGASHGMQLILMTQNPIDLIKNNVDQEFKANMPLSLVFGATLDSEKVKPIQQYFGLSTTAVEDLLNCDQGQGLLLISSRREEIPLHVEATEQEKAIIKGTYERKKAQVGYNILPEYQALREHHGVILKSWVQGDESYLIREGWEKITNLQKATGKGSFSMYVPVGSIQGDQIKLPGLGSMTLEHFSSVVQMESYLVAQKIECYSDHNQGADIVFKKNGRTYAVEYERGTRSEEDLIKKRDRLLASDDYRFVCSPENFEHISKIVDKTIQRGRSFADWVESLPA